MSVYNGKDFGSIIVNWGSMYSGKTEELLRLIKRANFAGKKFQLFKPAKDDRYDINQVKTHYGFGLEAIVVKDSLELLQKVDKDVQVIGIDEAQFFGCDLVEVCQKLKREYHIDVIISGLDMKFNCEPFEVMMKLAAISDKCTKFSAVCVKCGKDAYVSHRITEDNDDIVVGSEGVYVALCEKHHLEEIDKK
ncbi:Thymidine kinase [compost metagenome]